MLKRLEHRIKAAVFFLFRLFLKKGRADRLPMDMSRAQRVLFLRPEKIGDMIISLPVFDAFHRSYPDIGMAILGSPRNHAIIKDDPRFEQVFLYRKRLIKDLRELAAIRRRRYDCVLDMIDDDSVTTLFYSQLASKKAVRLGIGKRQHAAYYDFNSDHVDGVGEHIIDNTLELLEPLGVDLNGVSRFAPPYVSPAAQKKIDDFLNVATGAGTGVLVGFNLSAGRPNRIWPDDKAVELAKQLTALGNDLRLIIIVAPSDRSKGEKLLANLGPHACLVPDGLDLAEVSGLIAKLKVLISPDTSLIHIARAFEVPVVGLYSRASKNFKRWRPYRQPDGAVVAQSEYNVYDITVAQVFDRVVKMIQEHEAAAE